MKIWDFVDEFDNLSQERKEQGMRALFTELLRDPERYVDFLYDVADMAKLHSEDDYFGTEGLDV